MHTSGLERANLRYSKLLNDAFSNYCKFLFQASSPGDPIKIIGSSCAAGADSETGGGGRIKEVRAVL